VQSEYSWNTVTSQYERLFKRLTSSKTPIETAIGETRTRAG
jgi:hypothetical protein